MLSLRASENMRSGFLLSKLQSTYELAILRNYRVNPQTISSLVIGLRDLTLHAALLFCLTLLFGPFAQSLNLPIEKLKLPQGFQISIYAELPNPRQLALSDNGIVYAGSFRAGNLYSLTDIDSNGVADAVHIIDNNLNLPTGIAV